LCQNWALTGLNGTIQAYIIVWVDLKFHELKLVFITEFHKKGRFKAKPAYNLLPLRPDISKNK
jgi:hypothetical protein